MLKLLSLLVTGALCQHLFDPQTEVSQLHPRVKLPNNDVLNGKMELFVETFKGIPFAETPVGDLRFRPPVPYNRSLDGFNASSFGHFCIPMNATSGLKQSDVPENAKDELGDILTSFSISANSSFQSSEDCLNLNVFRPWASMTHKEKLPVMVWIYGGGFEFGSSNQYEFNRHVIYSMMMDQPIIAVSLNYRLGVFGFLGGKQILNEGSANAGLLDQRLALQWVAENIASFGGDPDNVTIFGQSAGSISVFHQMLLYDGDNTYKGKPLFHGAIMQSGVVLPAKDIDSNYTQQGFDKLASAAGCGENDVLACLRTRSSQNLTDSENVLPGVISPTTFKLSFMPRPDGKLITRNTLDLIDQGKFAKVPFIIGNQEDEATLFGITTLSINSTEQLTDYLNFLFDIDENNTVTSKITDLYNLDPSFGSPYRTGDEYQITRLYKTVSSILGDYSFHASRRTLLQKAGELDISTWAYQASTNYRDSALGTLHGSDIGWAFSGAYDSNPTISYLKYFISFANNKDPNNNDMINWPRFNSGAGATSLNISLHDNSLINDTFRQASIQFLADNLPTLLM